MESAVYIWFTQRRATGVPISGPLLCEKALYFNEKLGGSTNFKASPGWLYGFKSRHGNRQLEFQGESLSSDTPSSEQFKKEFLEIISAGRYSQDDIYNADETGIYWRALPRKSLASKHEKSVPDYKVSKERITALTCANASGIVK